MVTMIDVLESAGLFINVTKAEEIDGKLKLKFTVPYSRPLSRSVPGPVPGICPVPLGASRTGAALKCPPQTSSSNFPEFSSNFLKLPSKHWP